MSSTGAILLSAVLIALVQGQSQQDSGGCDAAKLAAALNSRTLGSLELFGLCSKQYAEAVCLAAGQSLKDQFASHINLHDVSLHQFAGTACSTVEAAALQHQQKALLIRQHGVLPREQPAALKSQELADIRSSADVHHLSLDVADHYRANAAAAAAGAAAADEIDSAESSSGIDGMGGGGETLDDVLHHKSLPIPHGRFPWELNHSMWESNGIENAVTAWKASHMRGVDIRRPEVKYRAKFFKKYSNRGAYSTVKVPGSNAVKIDVSMKSDDSEKESLTLPASYESVSAENTKNKVVEKPKVVAKSFLASGKELREVLSQVTGKQY